MIASMLPIACGYIYNDAVTGDRGEFVRSRSSPSPSGLWWIVGVGVRRGVSSVYGDGA